MASEIDNAVARLADIVLSMSTIAIKSAPDYMVENVEPCPFAAIYASGARVYATNSTVLHNYITIAVEFHLSRINIKQMQQQANAIMYEFPRRLAGDPTLNGTVETILFSADNPIEATSGPFEWQQVSTHRILFPVPVKFRPAPLTTA
jgi:hypothetical protein